MPIALLRPSDSPRALRENPDQIARLKESEEGFDPIVVHRDSMRVIDGTQRLRAAQELGHTAIRARFFDGCVADAFVLAVELNVRHGVPLTLAERKAAAARIIASHPQWSDRAVASRAGLSAGTVGKVRKASRLQEEDDDQSAGSAPLVRVGRDGRVRPTDSATRRETVARLLRENPSASLRQIAREAGVSPGTVRNVREQQRRPRPALAPVPTPDTPAPARHLRPARSPRSVTQRLAGDPSLRSTNLGRLLLRMLTMTTQAPWEDLSVELPEHLMSLTQTAALEQAEMWSQFAALLKDREEEES
ncbi:ParB/RepB/Spo0J family partition protein [Streptomyces diastatochromogenes]|uniref:ParB/RepB/Spo0J family partition protein n=1 Tax=Streptomyces diastatochromogenes TaxID=42236 RepID=UPI0036A8959D